MSEPIKKKSAKEKLEGLHGGHSDGITRSCQFFGYGILIGLFQFGKEFFIAHPIIACITVFFSVITLLLVYLYSVYQFSHAEAILSQYKEIEKETLLTYTELHDENIHAAWMESLYAYMRVRSKYIFWSFQITLIVSVICFLISSWFYFYGEHCESSTRIKSEQSLSQKAQKGQCIGVQKPKNQNTCE